MLFDTFAELDRELSRATSLLPTLGAREWQAPMDIRREDDRYVVEMDLPGVDPSSIDITLEGDWLSVRAERSHRRDIGDDDWVIRERGRDVVVRGFGVDETVDVDAIRADYTDGVLTLTLPLAEQAKPRKIALSGASTTRELGAGSSTSETAAGDTVAGKVQAAHSVRS